MARKKEILWSEISIFNFYKDSCRVTVYNSLILMKLGMSKQDVVIVSIAAVLIFSCRNMDSKQKNGASSKASKVNNQERFLKSMVPQFRASGKLYRKYKRIFARQTVKNEKIQTVTSDGLETSNTAKEGDFVVKNETYAQEMYIIGSKKFNERYRLLGEDKDGFSEYEPLGKVIGLELTINLLTELGLDVEFEFMAPWGEKMVAKKGDYLVTQLDYSEVYRIARKEFFETYEIDQK